jgi:class 3 adenylate cyclase
MDPTIAVHKGRIVKRTGDGSIVEFRSVVDAVRCAIEVQGGMVERNAGLPPERRIDFRHVVIALKGKCRVAHDYEAHWLYVWKASALRRPERVSGG